MKRAKTQKMEMNKTAIYCLSFSVLIIVLVFGLKTALASWQEPSLPPPQGNTPFLIDVGPDNQAKTGHLRLDPEFNTNNLPPSDITHVLEVRGSGAKISTLNVNGNLAVDLVTNDYTLFVNSNTKRVGIGTNIPSAKLSVEGGSLTVGKGTPVVAQAISATASGADSHGIYGVSTAPNFAGVYGINNDADSYGVYGDSLTCAGVYGGSDGIGVRGVTVSGDYGVYGINNVTAGNYWAGYFAGRLEATDEVIGSKFLPTKLQNSLVPYTSGWEVGSYSLGTGDYYPWGITFDGTYVWTTNSNNNTVSKIRISDGEIVGEYATGPVPEGITFDGTYIWTANWGGSGTDNVTRIKASDGAATNYTVGILGDDPTDIAFDGQYIWITLNSALPNNIARLDPDTGIVDRYSTGYQSAYAIAFDGEYIWATNSYTPNDVVTKIRASDGIIIGSYSVGDDPLDIVFDGTYLWTANWTSDNVTKILPTSDGAVVIGSYPVGNMPEALTFDGTYIWVTNVIDQNISRLLATDPTTKNDYSTGYESHGITFDGTYLWVPDNNGSSVKKIYSGTGYGHTDLSSLVNLQTSTPGTVQQGSFEITGTGTLGDNLSVGGDLEAVNNVWGDSGLGDESIDFVGDSADCATSGYFIKGIEVGASGDLSKILCRPL